MSEDEISKQNDQPALISVGGILGINELKVCIEAGADVFGTRCVPILSHPDRVQGIIQTGNRYGGKNGNY